MKLAYRPDIDGLRAIAVLLVIFFHLGFSTFSGGFIGVDVFFVISGFLITSIIYTDVSAGQFSFKTFYRKRMKRILPPFYLVCLVSLIAGLAIFTPQDLIDLGKHTRYAAGFISNIFLLKNAGYFAPESETLPLLHTWSLSIEEQFYLIWPALLILVQKKLKAPALLAGILVLSILSLTYSQYMLGKDIDQAYYQIQSRAWELLIGASLALFLLQGVHTKVSLLRKPIVNELFGAIGLFLIFYPALTLTDSSSFPGINALFPCLGTVLVIFSGCQHQGAIAKLLSTRAFVFLGLLSYSLYLWHWPIIAFTHYLIDEFTSLHAWLCIFATIAASIMSYYLIEKPLRFNHLNKFGWVLVCYLIIPICLFIFAAKLIKQHDGFPERLSAKVITQTEAVFSKYKAPLSGRENFPNIIDKVAIGPVPSKVSEIDAILWGDSHAMHMYALFDEIGTFHDIHFVASSDSACAPLPGSVQLRYGRVRDKGCQERNEATLNFILTSDIQYVVLSARWSLHYETTRYGGEKGASVFLGDGSGTEESIENTQRVFRQSLDRLIGTLQQHNKQIILVQQIPSYKRNIANCLMKKSQHPSLHSGDCTISIEEVNERQGAYRQFFSELKTKYTNLEVLSFDQTLCTEQKCFAQIDDIPLYKDQDHLNPVGARIIASKWLAVNKQNLFKQQD